MDSRRDRNALGIFICWGPFFIQEAGGLQGRLCCTSLCWLALLGAGVAQSVPTFSFFCGGCSNAAWTWQTDATLQIASALEKAEGVSKLN